MRLFSTSVQRAHWAFEFYIGLWHKIERTVAKGLTEKLNYPSQDSGWLLCSPQTAFSTIDGNLKLWDVADRKRHAALRNDLGDCLKGYHPAVVVFNNDK
jgi:hypothetical protein